MRASKSLLGLTAGLWMLGIASAAHAHGIIGKRFFPATLATDDPFVADELSLPTVRHIRMPGSSGTPPTTETDVMAEVSKRLSPNLGVSLGGTWKHLEPDDATSLSGFDNMDVGLKYVFFKSAAHETLLSTALTWEVGGTGSHRIGAEGFDKVRPSLLFGKGFGDLPDALDFAKPFALTGQLGVAMPTRHATKTISPDGDVDREVNPSVVQWGFAIEYNLQYLSSFVRDIGLPQPLRRMVPLIEFSMQTPHDAPTLNGRTTGTVNPGIIWFGRYVQVGIEAVIPVNERSGKNVGVLGQLHFYLDDILPKIFTWTPFHGVLGPTQPR